MNQTRVFLIFAWLMVATLLWFEWSRDKAAPAQPTVAAQTATAPAGSTVPTATDAAPSTGTVPAAPVATPGITQAPRAAAAPR
ncbi:MAG TPA: membrane protein insertase YidC, partial [Pseudoxanthomonas mexicana]|nr:membrane protein insertase YidC [Pseudoxanthomonas mexicana]